MDFSLADADYKVVTYIDSVGCTSCKLQLPRWKQFMQEVDSTLNRPIPLNSKDGMGRKENFFPFPFLNQTSDFIFF